jgi:hypothetical protein
MRASWSITAASGARWVYRASPLRNMLPFSNGYSGQNACAMVVAAGNFSLTATLLRRFALEAARFLPEVEVVEWGSVGQARRTFRHRDGTCRSSCKSQNRCGTLGTTRIYRAIRSAGRSHRRASAGTGSFRASAFLYIINGSDVWRRWRTVVHPAGCRQFRNTLRSGHLACRTTRRFHCWPSAGAGLGHVTDRRLTGEIDNGRGIGARSETADPFLVSADRRPCSRC